MNSGITKLWYSYLSGSALMRHLIYWKLNCYYRKADWGRNMLFLVECASQFRVNKQNAFLVFELIQSSTRSIEFT